MDYQIFIMALCIWREARGEGYEGMRAVAHVIKNRVTQTKSIYDVVTERWQFSSMTAKNDPQLDLYPGIEETRFTEAVSICNLVVDESDTDLTQGATHYFNPHVVLPEWASKMTKVASIGNHDFYKQV